jgi:hypothetical protein
MAAAGSLVATAAVIMAAANVHIGVLRRRALRWGQQRQALTTTANNAATIPIHRATSLTNEAT